MRRCAFTLAAASVAAAASNNPEDYEIDTTRHIVMFHDNVDMQRGASSLKSLGVETIMDLKIINGAAVSIPPGMFETVKSHADIKLVERDPPRFPTSITKSDPAKLRSKAKFTGTPLFNATNAPQVVPYGIDSVRALSINEGTQAGDVAVCIIDSGYKGPTHEDLPDATGAPSNLPPFEDGLGHGTHVAGTISAVDNDVGVIGVTQTNPLYIMRVFNDRGLFTYASGIVGAVEECVSGGHKKVIISMSLGCSTQFPALCYSEAEDAAFAGVVEMGHMTVAAAGNDGTNNLAYPASYDAVISVAAIDEDDEHAVFSQVNDQVEISAPGVAVISTVPMGEGLQADLNVAGDSVYSLAMQGSPVASAQGELVDCGLATTPCDAAGKICLIERGETSFAEKAISCQQDGGLAVILYNNEPGYFAGTVADDDLKIPCVSLSQEAGRDLVPKVGAPTSVALLQSNYEFYDGTSMACPHVSGVVARVWGHNSDWRSTDLRAALQSSATPLGAPGRDETYGFGKINAATMLNTMRGL